MRAENGQFAMPFVESSVIARIEYNPTRRAMFVLFTSGRRYMYFDVPENIYRDFLAAPSQGEFFNFEIRDRYRYRELK